MPNKETVTPAENGEEKEPEEDKNPHKNTDVNYAPSSESAQGSRGGLTTRDGRKPYH